jgi:hypothetical protein
MPPISMFREEDAALSGLESGYHYTQGVALGFIIGAFQGRSFMAVLLRVGWSGDEHTPVPPPRGTSAPGLEVPGCGFAGLAE